MTESLPSVRPYKYSCLFVPPASLPSVSDLGDTGSSESYDDSHHVDSKLELKKLGDAVVDISAPHHGLYDAAEVVISQNDVRSLLRHICPRNALQNRAHRISSLNLMLNLTLALNLNQIVWTGG